MDQCVQCSASVYVWNFKGIFTQGESEKDQRTSQKPKKIFAFTFAFAWSEHSFTLPRHKKIRWKFRTWNLREENVIRGGSKICFCHIFCKNAWNRQIFGSRSANEPLSFKWIRLLSTLCTDRFPHFTSECDTCQPLHPAETSKNSDNCDLLKVSDPFD